jgi:AAT family amino acid transporter
MAYRAPNTFSAGAHVTSHQPGEQDIDFKKGNGDVGDVEAVGYGEDGFHPRVADKLARKLTARQVQMIAIGGTIGMGSQSYNTV